MAWKAEAMRDFSGNHDWLSINTATIRKQSGAEVPLDRLIDQCAERGIRAISPWRDQVAAAGLAQVAAQLKAHGIGRARNEVRDGIAASLDYAREVGMPLAIEPLHPMQAADRACINTLEQALDLCDELDPGKTGALGVALDIYHVWWDPKLQQQIARAGTGPEGRDGSRLLAYHVCDWLTPTRDLLSDRGMMGDGVVELKKIRGWVEDAGFAGFSEVEIFSSLDWWQRPGAETLATCIERHRSVV
jgi:sugar phosphate isomerase/epimerase